MRSARRSPSLPASPSSMADEVKKFDVSLVTPTRALTGTAADGTAPISVDLDVSRTLQRKRAAFVTDLKCHLLHRAFRKRASRTTT